MKSAADIAECLAFGKIVPDTIEEAIYHDTIKGVNICCKVNKINDPVGTRQSTYCHIGNSIVFIHTDSDTK